MEYLHEDDPDRVLGDVIVVNLREIEDTEDGNGFLHYDIPDWWVVASGEWVVYQASTVEHLSSEGVGQYLCLTFGTPGMSGHGDPVIVLKAVSFQNDEQIAVFLAGLFGALVQLGGHWTKRVKVLNDAMERAMQEGEW